MLTKKIWGFGVPGFVLALVLSGCAPSGPQSLLEGDRLLREGKVPEAERALERAVELLPENARAWNHLGLAYHAAHKFDSARQAYHRALQVNRNLIVTHYNLGSLELEQGNWREAESSLRAFLAWEPTSAEAWAKLGTAQFRSQQPEAAERSLTSAVKLAPGNADAWNTLGLAQIQRRHYREAYTTFGSAVRAAPDHAAARLNLAVTAHQYLGPTERKTALQHYRDYLALKPEPADAASVRTTVQQLEVQLGLAPKPATTSTNLVTVPPPGGGTNVVANLSKPPAISTNLSRTNPPAAATNPVAALRTNAAPATNQVATRTSTPPAVVKAAPQAEIVRVPDEAPLKPARDVKPPAPPPVVVLQPKPIVVAPTESPAVPNVSEPATNEVADAGMSEATAPAGKSKKTVWQKANPVNWFHSSKSETPPPPADSPPAQAESGAAKKSVWQKMNPTGWFKNDSKHASSAESEGPAPNIVVAKATPDPEIAAVTPLPAPPPVKPRPVYNHYTPRLTARPVAGNRAAADAELRRGVAAHTQRDLTTAIAAYRKATELDPAWFDAQYNLAIAALDHGELSLSLLAGEYALAIDPDSVDARWNYALALQRSNYPGDAAEALERVCAAKPGHAKAHLVLAGLYAGPLGEPELARPHYQSVLDLEPQTPQAPSIRIWLAGHPAK